MRRFKFFRRKKGGYWVKTAYKGWITQSTHAFYIGYGYDPVILEEEYYKTKEEKIEAFKRAKEKNNESKI